MRTTKLFACDFETTVYENQEYTEVWSSACIELKRNAKPYIFHSLTEQFDFFKSLKCDIIAYYHNLKFDGSFWINYLLNNDYKNAYKFNELDVQDTTKLSFKDMPNRSFNYTISSFGQWYQVIIKENGYKIELRDSLKLFPFSLKEVGKAFKTEHQKLEMEYTGYRYAGCEITDEEKKYIENDVYVLQEALMQFFSEGHKRLTIGACCMDEFKRIWGTEYRSYFEDLTELQYPDRYKGSHWNDNVENVDQYIRKSYKGGWCYVVKGKENKIYRNGITLDVNSLYPYVMSAASNNKYPVGKPYEFWKGNLIPENAIGNDKYFFVRVKCRFKIKNGYLPFIQIKDSFLYRSNEMLESSLPKDKKGNYIYTIEIDNKYITPYVILTLTETDYYRFLEFYNVYDFEILDGCYFNAVQAKWLFDEYIKKYKKLKETSTGGRRTIAKLFLNNLYGKLSSSKISDFKIAFLKEDGSTGYVNIMREDKEAGSIAIASAITSYARDYTIRTAQANYYGKNKPGFIYSDTDSIHCDLPLSEIKNVNLHDTEFGAWKCEGEWDIGKFIRQKTYVEHIIKENRKEVTPYYDFKCAGMPKRCKDLLTYSIEGVIPNEKLTENEREFLCVKRTINDFNYGLIIPSKLIPKNIKGGVILTETTFELKERKI